MDMRDVTEVLLGLEEDTIEIDQTLTAAGTTDKVGMVAATTAG